MNKKKNVNSNWQDRQKQQQQEGRENMKSIQYIFDQGHV